MIVSLRNALVGNKNPTVDFHVLTLIAKADNTTVKLRKIGSPPTGVSIDYSVDNGTTWVKWEDNAEVTLASIGDAMLVQASNGYTNNGISSSARAYRSLQATSGNLKITGSVLSLVNSDINIALNTNLRQNGFSYLFQASNYLTEAEFLLHGKKLDEETYTKIFTSVFSGDGNLTKITTDIKSWYHDQFNNWVANISGTGEFHCSANLGTNLTIERGINYCPANWTVINDV